MVCGVVTGSRSCAILEKNPDPHFGFKHQFRLRACTCLSHHLTSLAVAYAERHGSEDPLWPPSTEADWRHSDRPKPLFIGIIGTCICTS